jgi:transcriptional regulator NrdR family protein
MEALKSVALTDTPRGPIRFDHLGNVIGNYRIEREIGEGGEKEIASVVIGERVMARLKQLDGVAYVRFASVYRQFRSVSDFVATLEGLGSGEASGFAGKEHLAVVV